MHPEFLAKELSKIKSKLLHQEHHLQELEKINKDLEKFNKDLEKSNEELGESNEELEESNKTLRRLVEAVGFLCSLTMVHVLM